MQLKFSRQALIADIIADDTLAFPKVTTLTVSGALVDGTTFEATHTIRVIDPPAKKQKKNKTSIKAKKNWHLIKISNRLKCFAKSPFTACGGRGLLMTPECTKYSRKSRS